MVVDVTGLSYFMPIIGFVFVFVIVYALLSKTKLLGESNVINLIIAAIVAIIFITMASAQHYVETVTPWFVILVIALFFMLIIVGMSQQKIGDVIKPGFVKVFIALLILVFLFSAIKVFPSTMGNAWDDITKFVTNESRIAGAIILIIIGGLTAWAVSKK